MLLDKSNAKPHFESFDGLRAIAVFMVMMEHYVPERYEYIMDVFKFGQCGVALFFVLSGFLIGGILLRQRATYQEFDWAKVKSILGNFYARRSLRIFPIYYLLLTALLIVGYPEEIKQTAIWSYTYTYNIYLYYKGSVSYPLGIIWTLCQEEQFYLMLPIILLATPRSKQLLVIIVMIMVGISTRTMLYLDTRNDAVYNSLVFSMLDLFGLGVMLAWLHQNDKLPKINVFWVVGTYLLFQYLGNDLWNFSGKSLLHIMCNMFGITSAILILAAINNKLGFLGTILNWQPIKYFGKISYGVYLYHVFCMEFLLWALPRMGFVEEVFWPIRFLIAFVATLGVASVSFYVIEEPINRLKSKFSY